jgi:demethylmenaquinone methyltransferase/2-methoxy-6-polyprenyl-1,4-benzoquinol methylase
VDHQLAQKNPEFVRSTFASIASRYDLANHLLSGGMDFIWRAKLARLVAACCPSEVLDLATGSGDLALAIKKTCPTARITAADFCLPMLEQARLKGVERLVQADGLALPFSDGAFDVLTVAFGLRNMADWKAAILEMNRVLRPGGVVFILDFSLPEWEPLLSFYRLYLHHVLPRLAHWATQRKEAYEYLGGSIETFPSGCKMNALLEECGFSCEAPRPLTLGVVSIYQARKRG